MQLVIGTAPIGVRGCRAGAAGACGVGRAGRRRKVQEAGAAVFLQHGLLPLFPAPLSPCLHGLLEANDAAAIWDSKKHQKRGRSRGGKGMKGGRGLVCPLSALELNSSSRSIAVG